MAWDGLTLQTEYSTTLGDTSTAFKAKTLVWMNDIQDDICSRFEWPFLRKTGKKLLTTTSEYQNLNIAAPSTAPSLSAVNGGSLTSGFSYSVRVTFYCSSNDYETEGGTESSSVSVSGTTLQINLTAIPVSTETLVTARRVYLKKDSGNYQLYSTISDNTTTTLSITADTSVTTQPPEVQSIKRLLNDPWLETSSRTLEYMPEPQMRLLFPGAFRSGSPEVYDPIDYNRIVIYPIPSSAQDIRYNYVRVPQRIFAEATSVPALPIWMKNIHQAGVLWKGYEYRERQKSDTYFTLYEKLLMNAISERAKTRKGPGRVRDVTGTPDRRTY